MTKPIALIAGNGRLPLDVGRSIKSNGYELVVIAIKNEAVKELSEFTPHWIDFGQIGKVINILHDNNCSEIILLGGISKRPNFKSIACDFGTISRLPSILSALNGGDDAVLRGVIKIFESDGFKIVGAQNFVPDLLAGTKTLTQTKIAKNSYDDIKIAKNAAHKLGSLDIGQALVVSAQRVIAVEAAEGTDQMLSRCLDLKTKNALAWNGKQGVLAKFAKPEQDLRVDLPTIGPQTVELVAKIGLAGIIVSGKSVIIAEKKKTIEMANNEKIFIMGV